MTSGGGLPRTKFNWRLLLILVGLIPLSTLLVLPYSLTLQSEALKKVQLPMPLPLLIAVQILQTTLLYGALAAIGLYAAGRIGLGVPLLEGWLAGQGGWQRLRRFLLPAVGVGALAGVLIIALDQFIFSSPLQAELARLGITLPASIAPPPWQGLLASFYGGITEEILLRLFVLTVIAWIGSRFSRTAEGRPTPAVLWAANVLAAILFGLGHLPATAMIGLPMDTLVITRAIVLNGLAGLAFGWFYWTFGLESAIVAHFSADIVLHVIVPLLAR